MIHKAVDLHHDGPVDVHLAGVGGNGSMMLSGLARLDHAMRGLGHGGLHVTAWDPDTVSEANIGRQMFYPADLGRNKAAILVHRVNQCFGLKWKAVPAHYAAGSKSCQVLITCLDSAKARATVRQWWPHPHLYSAQYWLDLGNRATDGQVILGFRNHPNEDSKKRQPDLPTVLDLYPEIAAGTVADDDAPSCSLAEALGRQQLFINQFVVTDALELLWKLLRFGEIDYHGAFVQLAPRRTTRLPIDPEAWKRFGYSTQHPHRKSRPSKGKA